MRINARLDRESEAYLEKVKQIGGFASTTDALKYSLKEAANHLEQESRPGGKFKGMLKSDFVGQFEGPEESSVDYKGVLGQGWEEKHGIV